MNPFPKKHLLPLLISLAAAAAAAPARGCSVCGCSLSSDWGTEGNAGSLGFGTDLTYQYYDQDDLRSGTHSVDRTAFSFPNAQEIQLDTLTRSVALGLDYAAGPHWGFNLLIPSYDRFHSTTAPGDTEVSESRATGPGDARLMARWQTFNPRHSFSLQLGLKLPTGRFNQDFATGPEAGTLVDRGLQLGTGTTDAIASASYFARPALNLGCFAQATVQQALAARDGFLPSSTAALNVGVRYLNTSAVTPQLQLNARWDGREHGVYADTPDSGDAAFFFSPGVTVQLSTGQSLFAFLQVPAYQRVNGLQLEPRWLLSAGFRWRR
jgi:hypothetical protein